MIIENGKYYLYRHIRLDKNEPFYIGIGKKPSDAKHDKRAYRRAFSLKNRNRQWYFITNKTSFCTEILLESNDSIFIREKEKEFISLYGRQDLKMGSLCNFTNGADGQMNRAKESIYKQLETSKNNGSYQKSIERLRYYYLRDGMPRRDKKVFSYNLEGIFLKEYKSITQCSLDIGVSGANISNRILKGKSSYKGYFITEFKKDKLDLSQFTLKKRGKSILMTDESGISKNFYSIKEAKEYTGFSIYLIKNSCLLNKKIGQKLFKFIE